MTATLPDFLKRKALDRNIPIEDIDELWEKHTEWCDQNGKDYGGRLWEALLDKVVERIQDTKKLDDKQARWAEERARIRRIERQAKDAADREYDAQAVSLGQWLASLRAQAADGELLEPHEALLASAEPPPNSADAAAWLMAALANVRTYDGKVPWRPNPCGYPGCGLPVRTWKGFAGRNYYSGRCVDHEGK